MRIAQRCIFVFPAGSTGRSKAADERAVAAKERADRQERERAELAIKKAAAEEASKREKER